MTDLEVEGVGDFLAERRNDIVALLMELANLESPSLVPESQHPIQELVTRRLEAIGLDPRHEETHWTISTEAIRTYVRAGPPAPPGPGRE